MTEAKPQDKATIQEAAKALHIDRKTIYRWIGKGLISKYVEGNKTYVLMEEVRAICSKDTPQDATIFVAENVASPNIVTVDRPHYEGLLIKLGQYEAERRYLLEYKTGLEVKDRELTDTKETLNTQAHELAAVRSELDKNSHELDQAMAVISSARAELEKMVQLKQESEKKARALMEREAQIERKNKELAELRMKLEEASRPWWRRLFRK